MASTPRSFKANIPVEVTSRCVLRLPLMEPPAIKNEIRRLIALNAPRCEVDVLIYAILRSHLHLLVVQDFSGTDPDAKIGISAFERNVLSGTSRYANGILSLQGAFVERSFRSWNCGEPEEALNAFAYIASNLAHHTESSEFVEDWDSGFPVYSRNAPDGVVTGVLGIFGMLSKDPGVRGDAIVQLVREMYAAPDFEEDGVEVARRVLHEHPELDRTAAFTTFAVGLWVGEEMQRRAREAVLKAPRVKVDFDPRRPPKLGEAVHIVYRNPRLEPLPSPTRWKEDDR